jgi:hypothetical protein
LPVSDRFIWPLSLSSLSWWQNLVPVISAPELIRKQ